KAPSPSGAAPAIANGPADGLSVITTEKIRYFMVATAIKLPYVYALDAKRNLWVFELPSLSRLPGNQPQLVARLIRSIGVESEHSFDDKHPIPTIRECNQIPNAASGMDILIHDEYLLCPEGQAITVFSLADPRKPSLIGRSSSTTTGGAIYRLLAFN